MMRHISCSLESMRSPMRSPNVSFRSKSVAKNLAEAGTPQASAVVCAVHLDDAAHFVQPRKHALADAVAQRFFQIGIRGQESSGGWHSSSFGGSLRRPSR